MKQAAVLGWLVPRALAACAMLLAVTGMALGYAGPVLLSSPQLSGSVVAASDGSPLEGAIIVARWEWDEYRRGGAFTGGGGLSRSPDAVHVAEAVSDGQGRFEIPSWGPVMRPTGQMAHDSPRLLVFKPGYAPFEVSHRPESASPVILRLAKAPANAETYAESIADFQSAVRSGLGWTNANDDWKRMPRMVMALQREKEGLGPAGRSVIGIPALHGRSGKGEIHLPGGRSAGQDRTGPSGSVVVAIAWQVRRDEGNEVRRFVQQVAYSLSSSPLEIYISPWRLPSPAPGGWRIDPDAKPMVRVYAVAHRMHADTTWGESGETLRMSPLAAGRDAELAELRRWRRDIDEELARTDTIDALKGQRPLARALAHECERLTADMRAGICLDPASPIAVAARERTPAPPASTDWGRPKFVRELKTGAGSPIGMTLPPAAVPPLGRKPVDGFRIVPAEADSDTPAGPAK